MRRDLPNAQILAFYFNPRTPCGVRLAYGEHTRGACHFNPRTPCGVRLRHLRFYFSKILISIHAPLTGCDYIARAGKKDPENFNPRTPYGVRPANQWHCDGSEIFQSTHPLRGATTANTATKQNEGISIHAPLTGCDAAADGQEVPNDISIHAPLTGCDISRKRLSARRRYFNPRTPCGVRPRSSSHALQA